MRPIFGQVELDRAGLADADRSVQPATPVAGDPAVAHAVGVEPVRVDQRGQRDGGWQHGLGGQLRGVVLDRAQLASRGDRNVVLEHERDDIGDRRTADRVVDFCSAIGFDAHDRRADRRHVVGAIGDRHETNRQLCFGEQAAQHRCPTAPQPRIVDDRKCQAAWRDRPPE